tara:strand:+ start:3081 stop:3368 length:288 start_codon:yes stop_codon:yes gene_type:complete
MLLKLKQLVIENHGYKRNIIPKNIYINSDTIISIVDYHGADNFLISESSKYSNDKFSLIRLSQGNKVEDIIAFGSAEKIYSEISETQSKKRILND